MSKWRRPRIREKKPMCVCQAKSLDFSLIHPLWAVLDGAHNEQIAPRVFCPDDFVTQETARSIYSAFRKQNSVRGLEFEAPLFAHARCHLGSRHSCFSWEWEKGRKKNITKVKSGKCTSSHIRLLQWPGRQWHECINTFNQSSFSAGQNDSWRFHCQEIEKKNTSKTVNLNISILLYAIH